LISSIEKSRGGNVMKNVLIAFLVLSLGVMAGPAAAGTLWYNGDFDGSGLSVSNHHEYQNYGGNIYFQSDSHVYDDFVVPAGGWRVNAVWSNNRFTSGVVVTGATWEIRSGLSVGNGGTVVASGSGTPTLTNTGRGTGSYTEYQVLISGLNFHLKPGRYWLRVTPTINVGDAYSYNSATSGLNAVGQPPGNNDNSYWNLYEHIGNGSEYSQYFVEPYGAPDFSMGIAGKRTAALAGVLNLLLQ
jgi:hypothetical protein